MLRRALLVAAGAGLLLASPNSLAAQDAWDVPSFQPPRPVHELGLYLLVPDRDDLGIMAMWRQPGGLNLGVRAGVLFDDEGDDTKYGGLVGLDVQGMLRRYGPQFPVDLSWTAGLGGTFNSTDEVRIPLGVSAGRRVDFDTIVLYPYVHPRVGIDIELNNGDDEDETDTRFGFTTDVGLDLILKQQVMLRLAASLLDRTGFGVGVAWTPSPAAAAR